MRKIIPIKRISETFDEVRFRVWLDKLTFPRIFLIWTFVILVFAFGYHFFSNGNNHLLYNVFNRPVNSIIDTIYFSFIIATSTGFGDIVPMGAFKIISVFEVIFGLMLLAFVTSKLVSLKQDIIINEIYDISFQERINRLRSSLLVFRQNLNRFISKAEDGNITRLMILDISSHISLLKDVLIEVSSLISTKKGYYTKKIDPLNTELIFNSILQSYDKINELTTILNEKKIDWKKSKNLNTIKSSIDFNNELFEKLEKSKILEKKIMTDLSSQKDEINLNLIMNIKK